MCLAVPTKVVTVEGNVATVDVQGVQAQVRLDALGEEVRIGDYLLVHAGFAIRRLDPEDAQETLALLDELLAGEPPASEAGPPPA
ncbi:MAG TPA: HypC/HybG/HupF family hydrogenase formation chaperone [Candidatus Acetothermia bacterium]|nr:HypC/HybG/HupF family hydrogenase formation chaperone [Candidatus Acetothermia bacterium]